jgi:hypothetical protein
MFCHDLRTSLAVQQKRVVLYSLFWFFPDKDTQDEIPKSQASTRFLRRDWRANGRFLRSEWRAHGRVCGSDSSRRVFLFFPLFFHPTNRIERFRAFGSGPFRGMRTPARCFFLFLFPFLFSSNFLLFHFFSTSLRCWTIITYMYISYVIFII